MVKVILKEGQVSNLVKGMLSEADWNFHFGEAHDGRPHISDNKFRMPGRDTGHFGSGTYFSTFNGEYERKDVDKYGESNPNKDPNFIQIGDNVYRVDFDLYKNLYRVRSKKHGDVLYTMMMNLNRFYNTICRGGLGRFNPDDAIYDNAIKYQIIKRNAEALGLMCPSYLELVRMAQKHGKDDEAIQSFSTLFMEMNGYNGVNVSGIDYYDNSRHGSVIYDLSKTNTDMEEVEPKSLFTGFGTYSSENNSIVRTGMGDAEIEAIDGDYILWVNKLNDMPLNRALRVLKNYTYGGHVFSPYNIDSFNDELARRYLMLLYMKNPCGRWGNSLVDKMIHDNTYGFVKLINKHKAYYWVNHESETESVLEDLLRNFEREVLFKKNSEELKKAYLEKLLSYMKRDLTEYEKEYIRGEYVDG